ncbi:cilia- and flagella-associated protein 52 [Arctopsyche grandis]|uniref:cilia- and flagella-associated protein 52 n=1 Tax=Arctopsyche grandis TaxID=121162 RepID=UPI00406D8DFD
MDEIKQLEIYAMIGFNGSTYSSLKYHPDGTHIVYPMGDKICIQNWITKKMDFLTGHSNPISALDVSPGGQYVGSGQSNKIGFKSVVILWDFETKNILAKHEYHMVRVESLVFSCDDSFMISIGGEDCGKICVWDIPSKTALCTMTAAKIITGDARTLASMKRRPNCFVTGGENNLRVWSVNKATKGVAVNDVSMGKLKRYIVCVALNKNDDYGYCGTTSGDIIKIKFDLSSESNDIRASMSGCLAKCGIWRKNCPRPETVFYSAGVACIAILDDETLIVAAGDGTVEHLEEMKWTKPLPKSKVYTPVTPHFKSIRMKRLNGSVTSLQIMKNDDRKKDNTFLVGMKSCEIYLVNLKTFQVTLVVTCHTSTVHDIAFPHGISEVFATAGVGDIRVWCLKTCQELLRIQVANFACSSVLFTHNGKAIVSGWDDGCIRAFTPLTGQLMYCILNTHNKGTTALAITSDGRTLISGGYEGQVRVWHIEADKQSLKAVLKEHKCPVSAIQVNNINTEAVSAGADGSCIIWDIIKLCRRQIMFSNTLFRGVCYEPTGCQIITVGTDRRVAYWQTSSGVLLRELEASNNGAVNALHINSSGESFVTGGNDQILKLWKYHEGIYTHIGIGHSGVISTASFSYDGKYIVSASRSGDIFVWRCPSEHSCVISVPNSAKSKRESPRIPLKFSPHKEENISTINTARSSVIANCPCTCKEKSLDKSKPGNFAAISVC